MSLSVSVYISSCLSLYVFLYLSISVSVIVRVCEYVCVSVCLIELDSERVTMDPSVDGSISEDIEYSSSSGDESSLEQPTFIFWLIFTIPSLTVRH